jgi:addiction module HigA family antidote
MAKRITPGDVVKEKLTEFHLSVREAAKELKLKEFVVRRIVSGKAKITPQTAFHLAKFFGGSAESWFSIQTEYDLALLRKDSDFQGILKSIEKAKKPTAAEIARKEKEKNEKRGRPAKIKKDGDGSIKAKKSRKSVKDDTALDASPKKSRGRPSKIKTGEDASAAEKGKTKGKRGRPRKNDGGADLFSTVSAKEGGIAPVSSATQEKKRVVKIVRKPRAKSRVGEPVEATEAAELTPKKPNSILIKKNRPKEDSQTSDFSEKKEDVAPLFSIDLNIPVEEPLDNAEDKEKGPGWSR